MTTCHDVRPPLVSKARSTVAVLAAGVAWWVEQHRRAPAVRAWSLPSGRRTVAGGLSVRVHGDGERVLLLLHGLAARGDFFGPDFDQIGDAWTVVAPDLLGFGASRTSPAPAGYGLAAHLAAIRSCLDDLGLADRRTVVAGHSMGASLALHVAADRPDVVDAVVSFSAPLFTTADEARTRMRAMGALEALFTRDDALSRGICGWTCRHRTLGALLAVALHPELPASLARTGVQHTYASFRGAFDEVVGGFGWQQALQLLNGAHVPVLLVNGSQDPVQVPGAAQRLARMWATVEVEMHPSADHGLPLAYPTWCLAQIQRVSARA